MSDKQYAWELAIGATASALWYAAQPAEVYTLVAHPVWRRGSLVSHQPIADASMEWRVGRATNHGVFEEAWPW